MKIKGCTNRNKGSDFTALFESINHIRQWGISKAIAVIGEKDFFIFNEMLYGNKPFTNIAPDPSIDKRDTPIRRLFAQIFDFVTKVGNDAVVICFLFRILKNIAL